MDTDPTPDTATTTSSRGFTGCAVALLVVAVLVLLGAAALAGMEKSLQGGGHLDNDSPSASVVDPLAPGATARYVDDLKVTVGRPRREDDGAYRFTITYANGTDEALNPGGESKKTGVSTIADAPVVVRAGKSSDHYPTGSTLTWLNEDEAASALMPPLRKGGKRTVQVRIAPGPQGTPVTVEVHPPSANYRETAYWQFDPDDLD
ncbi:hypothetical protein ACFXGI_20135 [Streptomyces sp. NPDC059355]|uniref:hypothetical protein n=1 Tax=Streptomyces sp. NPDC059355 TaxID=3346811 RepID=UPI0036D15162